MGLEAGGTDCRVPSAEAVQHVARGRNIVVSSTATTVEIIGARGNPAMFIGPFLNCADDGVIRPDRVSVRRTTTAVVRCRTRPVVAVRRCAALHARTAIERLSTTALRAPLAARPPGLHDRRFAAL